MTVLQSPEERFQDFLRTFRDAGGEYKYRKRLGQMAALGLRSLVVDFEDLIAFDMELAKGLMERPNQALASFEAAAWAQLKVEDPSYAEEVKAIRVRLKGVPQKVQLRKVGAEHIGRLLSVDGIIVRSTSVKPLLVEGVFKCRSCGNVYRREQRGALLLRPKACATPDCKGRAFDLVEEDSTFINMQEMRIQERPEDLPPGQLPRYLDVRLYDDLVDKARPGDRVTVTGVVRPRQEVLGRGVRLRTFELVIEASYIESLGREEAMEITPEDEEKIKELAKDPWLQRKLLASIAPSIYGHADLKEAIQYLLFGGVPKTTPDGINIRGDINVLVVGDPGTAKSQLLQYVAKVAPRGLYTSGRGASAAGLTAAVLKEKTGGMVLEAGVLVLADKGVACIDELEKMRPEDRVAIHEAMEQNTVSVAKGGIVATLNARTAILAAANPKLGRYDPYSNISDNINLPITILSRFDLIFIMRDIPETQQDDRMSEHILFLHKAKRPPEEGPIPLDVLRKYISYAKRIEPLLSDEASKELKEFYLKMRAASTGSDSPVAITPRQLEALIRLSEARARSFLRNEVTVEDARASIRLMKVSLQTVGIDTTTGKIDIDVIMTGKPKSLRDRMQAVLGVMAELEKAGLAEEAALIDVLVRKVGMEEHEARATIHQLVREGLIYSPKPGYLKRTAS